MKFSPLYQRLRPGSMGPFQIIRRRVKPGEGMMNWKSTEGLYGIKFVDEQMYVVVAKNGFGIYSDLPFETGALRPLWEKASGDVLVCGLGSGWIPLMLNASDKVKSITIVENNPHLTKLILPQIREPNDKINLAFQVVEEFIKSTDKKFDVIIPEVQLHVPLDTQIIMMDALRPLLKDTGVFWTWVQEHLQVIPNIPEKNRVMRPRGNYPPCFGCGATSGPLPTDPKTISPEIEGREDFQGFCRECATKHNIIQYFSGISPKA